MDEKIKDQEVLIRQYENISIEIFQWLLTRTLGHCLYLHPIRNSSWTITSSSKERTRTICAISTLKSPKTALWCSARQRQRQVLAVVWHHLHRGSAPADRDLRLFRPRKTSEAVPSRCGRNQEPVHSYCNWPEEDGQQSPQYGRNCHRTGNLHPTALLPHRPAFPQSS